MYVCTYDQRLISGTTGKGTGRTRCPERGGCKQLAASGPAVESAVAGQPDQTVTHERCRIQRPAEEKLLQFPAARAYCILRARDFGMLAFVSGPVPLVS